MEHDRHAMPKRAASVDTTISRTEVNKPKQLLQSSVDSTRSSHQRIQRAVASQRAVTREDLRSFAVLQLPTLKELKPIILDLRGNAMSCASTGHIHHPCNLAQSAVIESSPGRQATRDAS